MFEGTPRSFTNAATLLSSSGAFSLYEVQLIDTGSDRLLWESQQIRFGSVYGSTEHQLAFSTSYHSLSGPQVNELNVVTVAPDPEHPTIQVQPLEAVWPS